MRRRRQKSTEPTYRNLSTFLQGLSPDVRVAAINGKPPADASVNVPKGKGQRKTEHDEQVAVVDWARDNEHRHPELALLFAIPNGAKLPYTVNANGERFSRQGAFLRAEGMKAGVPDLFLSVARGRWHGLYIEMKRKGGKLSEAQVDMLARLQAEGYATAVPYSAEEAAAVLVRYLTGQFDQ